MRPSATSSCCFFVWNAAMSSPRPQTVSVGLFSTTMTRAPSSAAAMAAQQPASPAPMTSTSHFAVSAMSPSGMSSGGVLQLHVPCVMLFESRSNISCSAEAAALSEAGAPPWLAGAHPASAPPAMPAPASVDPIRNCLRDNDLFCVFFPMLMVPSCSGPALARSGSPANGAAVRSRSRTWWPVFPNAHPCRTRLRSASSRGSASDRPRGRRTPRL